MDAQSYLNRINFDSDPSPTLATLNALQKQHLLHIPFENLDIHANNPITLDTVKIFDKIVNRHRGGFCYELNGLFNNLLQHIGFDTYMVSARVFDKEKGYGNEFDHLVLIATIDDQEYLTDVGFGEFIFHPLKFELQTMQHDERGDFFIDTYDDNYFRINKLVDEKAVPQYIFTKTPRAYHEFVPMCEYHQTSEQSHFTHKQFLGIAIPGGRVTLVENRLKIVKGNAVTEKELDHDAYQQALLEYFHFKPEHI